MNIIITMAGEGKRFRNGGYMIPKHMIEVKGKSMFEWAMLTLKDFYDEHFVFITLAKNKDGEFIKLKCDLLGIKKRNIVPIDKVTSGQAETVLKSKNVLSNLEEPILIYNIDTYVEPDQIRKDIIKGDGWIPSFKAEGLHWSFVKFDETLKVQEVTERIRISNYASIGMYYFKSFNLFEEAFTKYYNKETPLPEKYIAPIYTFLINHNRDVFTTLLDSAKVHVLGTPEEVELFKES